jgi:hypothetical protein
MLAMTASAAAGREATAAVFYRSNFPRCDDLAVRVTSHVRYLIDATLANGVSAMLGLLGQLEGGAVR